MRLPQTIVLCALVAAACAARDACAQLAPTYAIRADNDAFNFWLEPGRRSDREYTSGVVFRYDGGDAPGWTRRLARGLSSCADAAIECRTRRFEVGQQMFTPARTRDDAPPAAGSRPNAGWLFIRDGIRMLSARRQRELSVTIGVTGPPALAAQTQRLFHALAPGFNRPIDWSEQLAFEPGVIVSLEEVRRLLARDGRRIGFDVLPHAGLHGGNVTTSVEAGARVRTGIGLAHPWLAPHPARTGVTMELGGSTRYVVRDLFLDGNTGGDRAVGHVPRVHRVAWSLSVRHGPFVIGYGAVTQTRAYPSGPGRHTWSTLSVSISPSSPLR